MLEGTISRVGDIDTRGATFRQHEGHEHDLVLAAFIAGIVGMVAGIHEDAVCRIDFPGEGNVIAMIDGQVAGYDCCPEGTPVLMSAEYTTGNDCVPDHGNL